MGGVRPLVIVEGDPFRNAGFGLRSGLPSVQIDAFVFQGTLQALDEDVVETTALAVHRDPGADPLQPVCPGKGRELGTLIGLHDIGAPDRWMASFSASTQKATSSVLEMRQAGTFLVDQSMMATS